jgi:hypothetical protein
LQIAIAVSGSLLRLYRQQTPSKPDKAAIKEALKAGQLIPGAQLLSRRSWRIC